MPRRRFITRPNRPGHDEFHESLAPARHMYAIDEADVPIVAARPLTGLELLVGWISGVITALLAIRFVFSLMSVNQDNGVASFVYTTTNGFTNPFSNLFNFQPNVSLGYFDLPAVAAIIAVALVSWAIVGLLRLLHA